MTTTETTSSGYEAKLNQSCGPAYTTGVAAPSGGQWFDGSTGKIFDATDIQVGTTVAASDVQFKFTSQTPVCAAGHEADPNYAEYLDGEIATTCMVCKQRIVFRHLPGGVPLLRLKYLLENLMGGNFMDRTRALEDFAAITDALAQERTVLDAADALAALARTLLEQ